MKFTPWNKQFQLYRMDTGTPWWGHLGKWDRARPERSGAQIFPMFAGLPQENHKTNQSILFKDA